MIDFCGALDFEKNEISFSTLKRMCGLHGAGSAYIKDEFGILCQADSKGNADLPVTLSHNGALYTAAISSDISLVDERKGLAEGILEGYFEVGEEFVHRLGFSYALSLYDGRCGELWLSKGHLGDKSLYYTEQGSTLYFSSALRPLIRLYGGCVRVSERVLLSYLSGDTQVLPTDLFCDIRPIRRGQSLFCSRLGRRMIQTPCGVYLGKSDSKGQSNILRYDKGTDMRRVLTDALFAFEYPQFDATIPAILSALYEAKRTNSDTLCIYDPLISTDGDYACERTERLGRLFGVDLNGEVTDTGYVSARELKMIDKALNPIFEECVASAQGAFAALLEKIGTEEIREEKNIPLRIRRKGMVIQTRMWLDTYNLVLV